MAELRIRVIAVADRSLSVAHRPLLESAQRATVTLGNEAKKAAQIQAKEQKKATDTAAKELAAQTRLTEKYNDQIKRNAEKTSAALIRAHEQAEREKTRATRREAAEREREHAREVRSAARNNSQFNAQVGRGARAGVGIAGRAAAGIVRSLAAGTGVDLSMASHMANATALEKDATDLSNAGYMAGKPGAAGVRQDPGKIAEEIRRTAQATASTGGEAVEGLQGFVGKTGDLQTGREVMFDMAKLAKATGSSLKDMMDAAGDVANGLGNVEDKSEKIKNLMAVFSQQGKEGAVEIKNLASQMAGLQAAASKFEGDGAKNLALMGGLAQLARSSGGAKSAPQAVTSVQALTAQFSKEKRLKGMAGLDVQAKNDAGFTRPLNELLVDILKGSEKAARAGGHGMRDFDKISMSAIQDQQARRAFDPLANIYKHAGGGDAGVQAVTTALAEMTNATMTATEINESFAKAMDTDAAKAAVVNAQFDALAAQLKTGLIPAAQALVPVFLAIANKVTDWVDELTGAKKKRQMQADTGAENGAVNAYTRLKRVEEAGNNIGPGAGVDKKEVDEALSDSQKAQAALRAAIAKKEGDVENEAFNNNMRAKLGAQSDAEVRAKAASGDENAQRYVRESEQLARMRDDLSKLTNMDTSIQKALAGELGKTLNVNVVSDTTKTKPDAGGNGGRQKPPGPDR